MPHKTLSTAQNAASSARMGQLGLWIARHPKKVIALALLPAVFYRCRCLRTGLTTILSITLASHKKCGSTWSS